MVPHLNRIPINPHICGVVSVFISSIFVAAVTPEGRASDWARAVSIAGLAALMTGPMLRGYDKKNKDREASTEQSGEQELRITRDLKS